MTFRNLLLTLGAAAALAGPSIRTETRSLTASVVWGACTRWSNLERWAPSGAHALPTQHASLPAQGRGDRRVLRY